MNFYASQIKSGAIGINETYIQFVYPGLPFGGQQSSGIGKSHGEFGFHEFSVKRSIVEQSFTKNAVKLVHPPYTSLRNRIAKLVTRWL
jgi:aldehyde dehydrogenase (NAD+)